MKEYKTLRVKPQEESRTMEYMEIFNWHLDNRQEVYNRSEHIVGMTTDGITRNIEYQGRLETRTTTQVETEEEITHFIALSFSRETDTKNHSRIIQLEKEMDNFRYSRAEEVKKVPNFVLGAIICIIVAVLMFGMTVNDVSIWYMGIPFLGYATYCIFCICTGKKQQLEDENDKIEEENAKRRAEEEKKYKSIINELDKLLEEERTELKERGLLR